MFTLKVSEADSDNDSVLEFRWSWSIPVLVVISGIGFMVAVIYGICACYKTQERHHLPLFLVYFIIPHILMIFIGLVSGGFAFLPIVFGACSIAGAIVGAYESFIPFPKY